MNAAPHNLPAERSSFIGREQETLSLRRLIDEHRLITLTGIGGSGKTRLALQVGALELAAVPGRFPDGVFFVDLAPVADSDLVAQTLAAACGLALGVEGEQVVQVPSLAVPGESAPDAVTDAMRLVADRAHAAQ